MLEGRLLLLMGLRQGDPGLDRLDAVAGGALGRRGAFGMDDAAPGGHPVHRAGPDRLIAAQAVAVVQRAVEQPGDGGEADMRVRAHVHALAGRQFGRAQMVEEHEGADIAALGGTAAGGGRRTRPDRAGGAR